MNHVFKLINVEDNGKIHFNFIGSDIQDEYEVSVIDENTGLVVHKDRLKLKQGSNWWISTGSDNARRLRHVGLSIKYGNDEVYERLTLRGESRHIVVNGDIKPLSNDGDDLFPIVCEVFFDKVYERDFVKLANDDIVVDIGANYGVFSLYAQNFNPKIVYSIEPSRPTFRHLKKNVEGFNVVCINKAISNDNGYEVFITTPVNGNNYSLKNTEGYHPSQATGKEIVETTTINQLLFDYDIQKIDFLKIDCDGAELDIFTTINKEFLINNIHKIVVEYHSNKNFKHVLSILNESMFFIEDYVGDSNVGLIYAYNKNYIA